MVSEIGETRIERRQALRRRVRRRRVTAWAVLLLCGMAGLAFALTPGETTPKAATASVSPAVTPPPPPPPLLRNGSRRLERRSELRRLIETGLPIYCGGLRGRDVALTFDDGPGVYTGLALRVLARFRARATFFLVGRSIERFPELPRDEARLAAFGDHTWTHRFLPALPPGVIRNEIADTKGLIRRSTGKQVLLFRPPYAARSRAVDQQVRAAGLLDVLWNVDSRDWVPGTDWRQTGKIVIAGAKPGAIVSMHENHGQTIEALRFLILPAIHHLHLRAVTVPQLLEQDPPSLRQLRQGYTGCGSSSGSLGKG